MSDKIKTQHGTIGLLMAECEQLRRDIVVEENRHKAARDDCLRERRMVVKLHAELAQAKAENARLAAVAAAAKVYLLKCRCYCYQYTDENGSPATGKCAKCQGTEALCAEDGAETALRDLLAPTIELLKSLKEYQTRYQQPHLEDVKKELTRLRSITERKP